MDGTRLALNYNETLDWDSVPPAGAFTVKKTSQGGTEETVGLNGPPDIRAGVVLLTLANPVLSTDTDVKVSYAKPTGATDHKLQDKAGNEAAGFTDQAVGPDTTPPELVRGEIDGDTLIIHFSEALDEDALGGRFRVNLQMIDRSGNAPDYGECRNTRAGWNTFTTNPWEVFVNGNTAVVVGLRESDKWRAGVGRRLNNFNFTASAGSNTLRDLAGNPVHTPHYIQWLNLWRTDILTLDNVTRLPSPERATVVGNRLTLTFSAPLDRGSVPAANTFTVKVGGSPVSLAGANPVSVSGHRVTLTLAAAVASGDAVTVSYAKPDRGPVQNVICEDAPSFTDRSVLNFTGVSAVMDVAISSDPGDDDTYGSGDVIRVRLTFSEAVKVTGRPRLKIDLAPAAGGEKWMWYESGSGTASLTFARKVVQPAGGVKTSVSTAGIAVLANSLELNGGAIQYVSSGKPAYLSHSGLGHDVGHKVDWRR